MKAHRTIGIFLAVLAIAGAGAAGWLLYDYSNFVRTPLTLPVEGLEYRVERGATLRDVAEELDLDFGDDGDAEEELTDVEDSADLDLPASAASHGQASSFEPDPSSDTAPIPDSREMSMTRMMSS